MNVSLLKQIEAKYCRQIFDLFYGDDTFFIYKEEPWNSRDGSWLNGKIAGIHAFSLNAGIKFNENGSRLLNKTIIQKILK